MVCVRVCACVCVCVCVVGWGWVLVGVCGWGAVRELVGWGGEGEGGGSVGRYTCVWL